MAKTLGALLLLGTAAALGAVIYRAVLEQRAEQDLWTDASFDASLDLGPVSNVA
jgi:hypothetical protein